MIKNGPVSTVSHIILTMGHRIGAIQGAPRARYNKICGVFFIEIMVLLSCLIFNCNLIIIEDMPLKLRDTKGTLRD